MPFRLTDAANTPGGHIFVALFIFAVGIGLLFTGQQNIGGTVITGALACIYTSMRGKGQEDDARPTN